jgi:acyl dehydratase
MLHPHRDAAISKTSSSVSAPSRPRWSWSSDPQYFHADPEAARSSVFGEVIASGIYTMALWRKLDHEIAADIAWICGVAWEDVRWPHAVRVGDRLRARAECVAKRESAKRPERGVVDFRYTLLDAEDRVKFTCLSINLVERRPQGALAPTARP